MVAKLVAYLAFCLVDQLVVSKAVKLVYWLVVELDE